MLIRYAPSSIPTIGERRNYRFCRAFIRRTWSLTSLFVTLARFCGPFFVHILDGFEPDCARDQVASAK
ncbi:hypothetical protein SAMN02927900_03303 [Rhizobium mongolense subsp. loessense]|uniref:Uncharacterized protein n=1 Tax=Rhizobium mongolense subsp. loessense TaxID=158890 RepID=A0A1G4S0U5_9HYPH|nr:hypothetical protein SAMN02927900_03303 [Rhizobium mongolense subsp. loessense]